jgi:D-aspartate ligase
MARQATVKAIPDAVIVGLCAHGLAISRALRAQGLEVVALETNHALPGTRTNTATIKWVADINSERLIAALAELATWGSDAERPVLFLTNDRMVSVVSRHL